MNTQELSGLLCRTLCASAEVSETRPGLWRVQTPFVFPDGDGYSLYVQQLPSGGVRAPASQPIATPRESRGPARS